MKFLCQKKISLKEELDNNYEEKNPHRVGRSLTDEV